MFSKLKQKLALRKTKRTIRRELLADIKLRKSLIRSSKRIKTPGGLSAFYDKAEYKFETFKK